MCISAGWECRCPIGCRPRCKWWTCRPCPSPTEADVGCWCRSDYVGSWWGGLWGRAWSTYIDGDNTEPPSKRKKSSKQQRRWNKGCMPKRSPFLNLQPCMYRTLNHWSRKSAVQPTISFGSSWMTNSWPSLLRRQRCTQGSTAPPELVT